MQVSAEVVLVYLELQLGDDEVRRLHLVVVTPRVGRRRSVWAGQRVDVLLVEQEKQLAVHVRCVHVHRAAALECGGQRVDVVAARVIAASLRGGRRRRTGRAVGGKRKKGMGTETSAPRQRSRQRVAAPPSAARNPT